MSGQRKEYVIDPARLKPRVNMTLPPMRGANEGTAGDDTPSAAASGSGRRARAQSAAERRPGWPLLLWYCAGPFAIFATSRGRKERSWIAAALLSMILGAIAALSWDPLVSGTSTGSKSAVAVLVILCAALTAGFAAWTRGIFLIGRQEGARIRRIPDMLKRPAGTGLLGSVLPGLGLLVSGRPRQAAAALWMVCATLLSIMILSQADWLWRFDRRAGALSAGGRALEYLFIFLFVCGLLGVVSWVVQALDGMRHAAKGNGRTAASRTGVLILVSCAVFVSWSIAFERGNLAGMLDRSASALHREGLQIAPLVMSETAMRLDSSRPAYVARAISLYESIGAFDRALALRRSLVDRLVPCIAVLEEEGLVTRITAAAPPPGGDAIGGFDSGGRLLPAELMLLPQAPAPFGP